MVILRKLSEIALKRAGLRLQKLALKRAVSKSLGDWLETGIGSAESAAVIGWIPRRLLAVGWQQRCISLVSGDVCPVAGWQMGGAQILLLRAIVPAESYFGH